MWVFAFTILTAYIEQPYVYFDFSLIFNDINYYYYEEHQLIEIDIYKTIDIYLETEDYLLEDKAFTENQDIEVFLELTEDFEINNVGYINIEILYNEIELIVNYDGATVNYNYDLHINLSDRENNALAYKSFHFFGEMYYEINNNYPIYYKSLPSTRLVYISRDMREIDPSEAYQNGYDAGYTQGEKDGHMNGYIDGYDDGKYVGEMTQPIFKLFNAVFRSIDNVLQTEVLPGIKLWYIVSIPLVFLIIQFFINLWR